MHLFRSIFSLLILVCLCSRLQAEEFSILDKTSIITIELEKTQYKLGYDHIITGSEEVSYQDSVLTKGADYSLDHIRGIISFVKELAPNSRVK
ncbi:MAG TPA: hypothetical protein ENL10_02145, partial [Candidatus Cloacimonetes bacterium]|nr:hypothetical protein [Candidatus Cloacimonadota bacterium]